MLLTDMNDEREFLRLVCIAALGPWGLLAVGYINVLDERSLREGASLWGMISKFGLSNTCAVGISGKALHVSLDVRRDASSIIVTPCYARKFLSRLHPAEICRARPCKCVPSPLGAMHPLRHSTCLAAISQTRTQTRLECSHCANELPCKSRKCDRRSE